MAGATNFTVTLVPGYTWQDGETWTAEKANLAANPAINLTGSLTGAILGPGAVSLANIASGIFTANSSGWAPFVTGWLPLSLIGTGIFTANTAGWAPFAEGWLPLSLVGDGIFTATVAGRAPFAAGFVNAGLSQVDAYGYAVATGTGSAYVAAYSPAPSTCINPGTGSAYTGYWDGLKVVWKSPANSAANATFKADATFGAQPLYTLGGTAFVGGEILSGSIVEVVWNSSLNSGAGAWQLLTGGSGWGYVSTYATTLAAGSFTFQHNLGAVPSRVSVVLVCVTADGGFGVGAEVPLEQTFYNGTGNPLVTGSYADGSYVYVTASATPYFYAGGAMQSLTAARWKLKVRASL